LIVLTRRSAALPNLRLAGASLLAALLTLPSIALHAAAVPQTMLAAAIDRADGPLTLHTLPVPKPAANEVSVRVRTAAVQSWDILLQQHPEIVTHSRFPFVLGTDGSGVVAALGSQVRSFKLSDPVYAGSWDNPNGGFYAEYVRCRPTVSVMCRAAQVSTGR
jgi:NADPH:quinone reductase-like Zn-dependent oxidoreductase